MSAEVSVEALQQAVEGLHGCTATFNGKEHVHETFQGQTAWEGTVHVFDLKGHETASAAYAWSDEVPGSDRRRFFAVLKEGPVQSAGNAIQAAIVESARATIESDPGPSSKCPKTSPRTP